MNRSRVQQVVITDPLSGQDGARIDRILSGMQNSHSQIRVICGDTVLLSTSATATTFGVYTGTNVRATDDFTSIAQQYETFRIAAIRFEVYDVNPGSAVFAGFSTQHDVSPPGGTYGNPTIANVMDGPDASLPPAGGSKAIFNWVAHGTAEIEFQTDDLPTGPSDFGGLRYFFGSPGAAVSKYQLVVKAVVDFRGRI